MDYLTGCLFAVSVSLGRPVTMSCLLEENMKVGTEQGNGHFSHQGGLLVLIGLPLG